MYLQLYYAGVHKRCKLYMFRVSTKHIPPPHSVYLLTYKYIRSHPIKKCDWNRVNQHLDASYSSSTVFVSVICIQRKWQYILVSQLQLEFWVPLETKGMEDCSPLKLPPVKEVAI